MGRDPRPRAPAQSDCDKRQISVANLVPEFLFRNLGAPLADLRPAAGSHPARHPAADQELAIRLDRIEMHCVGIHNDRSGAVDPHAVQAMDGIPTRASASDYEDLRASEAKRVEERLVPGALRRLDAHP